MNKNYGKMIIILLFIISIVLPVVDSSVTVDTDTFINFGSPNQNFSFWESQTFESIVQTDTYVVFNQTGFNLTVSSPIIIEIVDIQPHPFVPVDTYEDLIKFKVNNNPGSVDFSVSGWTGVSSDYFWVLKNNVTESTGTITNGFVNWTDSPVAGDEYQMRLAIYSNTPTTIVSNSPENQSTGDIVNVSLSAVLFDIDITDTLTWSIWTNHSNGEVGPPTWKGGKIASGTTDFYQRIWANTTTNFTKPNTRYWWSVNVTDGTNATNATFYFNTVDYISIPTLIESHYHEQEKALQIVWANRTDDGQDNYTIVARNDTFSTSVNQSGNWIMDNNSRSEINITSLINDIYITIYSWNETSNIYSYNRSNEQGLQINWGAIRMSCWNASNGSQNLTFNVQISNSDFSETYVGSELENPTYLDLVEIPYGEETIILVSADNYESTSYTYDIFQNNYYNLSFYLEPKLPDIPAGGGGSGPGEEVDNDTAYAENYVIRVVGPQTEYGLDPPIENAYVEIKRYVDIKDFPGLFVNVYTGYTGANGEVDVALVPGVLYQVNITKSGYNKAVEVWIPVEIVFEADRYKTFRLTEDTTTVTPDDYDLWVDYISFTTVLAQNQSHINLGDFSGYITITYADSNASTVDTQIYVYQLYNNTRTLVHTDSRTGENSFSYMFEVDNVTRDYDILVYFNNTASFDVSSPFERYLAAISIFNPDASRMDLEDRIIRVVGPNELGWVDMISAVVALCGLVLLGPKNTDFGIMLSGFLLGLVNGVANMWINSTFNPTLTLIIPAIIIIGVIYAMTKNPSGTPGGNL